jgi:hypothetical protein
VVIGVGATQTFDTTGSMFHLIDDREMKAKLSTMYIAKTNLLLWCTILPDKCHLPDVRFSKCSVYMQKSTRDLTCLFVFAIMQVDSDEHI